MIDKKKISLRLQVFVALMTIIVIMAAIFSPYGFYTNVSSIRKSLDERLLVAANGVKEFMPADFVDKALDGSLGKGEYDALKSKLLDFKTHIGVTYLYAMVRTPDGKIRYVLDQELEPLAEYEDPSADTLEAFKTKKMVSAQCDDTDYGLVSRTVLLPFYTPKGTFYVVGADLNLTKIRPMVLKSIFDFSILMLIGLVMVLFITARLTRQISMPIKKLSEFTQKLSDSNFSPDLKIADTVAPTLVKTKEVAILASSVEMMREKLHEYIVNLEREVTARNLAETELKIAGGIQESFLPGAKIDNANVSAAARMKPAKKAGGDLYDFFEMSDGRTCFAIGDVSGKGMPAAMFMARAITLIRSAAYMTTSLAEIVKFINDMLSESNDSCMFITFFICAYDSNTGVLEFVNCGHNPPYLKSADGEVKMLSPKTNRILGVFGGVDFAAESMALNVGDTLVCYTDGVNEAIAADESFYGDKRFEELIGAMPTGEGAGEIVAKIFASVLDFEAGCEQSDDITVLVIRRKK